MSRSRVVGISLTLLASVVLASCGGSGQGLRMPSDSVRFLSTSLPAMTSGVPYDYQIPLTGGCGGPYVMKTISGGLPAGLVFDPQNHAIRGTPLVDGVFSFEIQIQDTGCNPFSAAAAKFSANVTVGAVTVVDVLQDGNPSLSAPGTAPEFPDLPALPNTVYNEFTSLHFLCAGGQGPYTMKIADDPANPDDGALPLGVSVAPKSTDLVGSPAEVGPNEGPFCLTFDVQDSLGNTSRFTCCWRVDTPPILVAVTSLANGACGQVYSEQLSVSGGVPPFSHELVEKGLPLDYTIDRGPNPSNPSADVIFEPGAEPTVNPPEALNRIDSWVYPAPAALGPNYAASNPGAPPEGVYIVEDTGSLRGIPRRRGAFLIHYHVKSALVPLSFGQHAWRSFNVTFSPAPAPAQNPAYTVEGSFSSIPPYARVPEMQQGQVYNPDAGPLGLQLLATGGVPQDGYSDHPHKSQIDSDPVVGETAGAYLWSIDWDPDGLGSSQPLHVEFLPSGVLRPVTGEEANLVPQAPAAIAVTAQDFALPQSLAGTQTQKVRLGIGPDRIIVTQSTTSYTSDYYTMALNDPVMTVRMMLPYTSGAQLRNLNDSDLVGNGTDRIPLPTEIGSSTSISTLLTNIDIVRVSVNPTGWWDDTNALNPRGARPWQHGDRNEYYPYYGIGYNGNTYDIYGYNSDQVQPSATAVRLPACTSSAVTADLQTGVYTDGGKLYVFDAASYFGIFIIRKDGRIYVPAAFSKSGTWSSFGDNWMESYSTSTSQLSLVKIPQMTVSPDGRFAAFKLRRSLNQWENASSSGILLISLTGERVGGWGDDVHHVISTGSDGSWSQGEIVFASSLTLTGQYLYYLVGSGSTDYMHFRDHYIYRADITSGASAGALLHPGFSSAWPNSPGSPMQTPFQCFSRSFGSSSGPDMVMISTYGYNGFEASLAPHPFRVSSDGRACAILASPTPAGVGGSDVLLHNVWVDYDGNLSQVSTKARHSHGGGRGTALTTGPVYYPVTGLWGRYNGPTTAFEISDDGLKVAVVVSRADYVYAAYSYYDYNYDWQYREDVVAFTSSGATPWQGSTELQVTGNESGGTPVFSNSLLWRFGALTFTRAGDGLVFWGGYSCYSPSWFDADYSYMASGSKSFIGSLYSYSFSDNGVRSILSSSDGGCNLTVGSTQTSISFSTSQGQTDGGVIRPWGGFLSKNGNFFYIVNHEALSTSDYTNARLVGVNVRSLDSSSSINSHLDGRAFAVGGMGSSVGYHGFYPFLDYTSFFGMGSEYYYYHYHQYYNHYMGAKQVASTDNGWVFFFSDYQPYSSNASGWLYDSGGSIRNTGYSYGYEGHVFVFDPNVGGSVQRVTGSEFGADTGYNYRFPGFLEVSDDGSGCAVVYGTNYPALQYEQLIAYSRIRLNPTTGALLAGKQYRSLEPSITRVSSCISFDSVTEKLLYAAGSGNENSKTIKAGTLATGSTTTAYSGFGTKSFNILHAGR